MRTLPMRKPSRMPLILFPINRVAQFDVLSKLDLHNSLVHTLTWCFHTQDGHSLTVGWPPNVSTSFYAANSGHHSLTSWSQDQAPHYFVARLVKRQEMNSSILANSTFQRKISGAETNFPPWTDSNVRIFCTVMTSPKWLRVGVSMVPR